MPDPIPLLLMTTKIIGNLYLNSTNSWNRSIQPATLQHYSAYAGFTRTCINHCVMKQLVLWEVTIKQFCYLYIQQTTVYCLFNQISARYPLLTSNQSNLRPTTTTHNNYLRSQHAVTRASQRWGVCHVLVQCSYYNHFTTLSSTQPCHSHSSVIFID